MKQLGYGLFLITALAFSTQAIAQNVFLVQLGSYKSEQEADKTWASLKKENKATLADLFHQNSAIALPPSNAKVFRLQAGPFVTREDASSVCNDLSQQGTDCFIVESAGFAPKEPPVAATTKEVKEEVVAADPVSAPEPESKPAVVALPAELPSSVPVTKMVAEKKEETATLAENHEKIAEKAEKKTEEAASPSLFDEIASIFSDSGEEPAKTKIDAVEKNKQPKPIITKKKPAKVAKIKAVPQPEKAEVATNAALPWSVKEKPTNAGEPEKIDALPEKLPFGRVGDPYKPIAAPSPARAELLPPPTRAGVLAMPQTTTTTADARDAESAEPVTVSVPEVSPAKRRRVTQNDLIAPTDKRVEVGEAIPVPLSNQPKPAPLVSTPFAKAAPAATAAIKEPTLSARRPMAWNASPSRNLLQHSYWVQLSYFKNEQAALNEWQALRQKMPNLSKQMRVRVTKPYVSNSAEERISLQVGPFLSNDDVNKLCQFAASENIRCGMSKDLGASTAAAQSRGKLSETGYIQPRDIAGLRPGANAQYWVQLGTYRSRGEASKAWEELRQQHIELQAYLPAVHQPTLSSSPEPVYRLRTGPFQIRYAAQELCDQLRDRSTGCIVVTE